MTIAEQLVRTSSISRRQVLVGATMASLIPAVVAAGGLPDLSLDRPSDRVRLLLRAISTLDPDEESFIFLSGVVYGLVPGEARPEPLFGIALLMVSRVLSLPGRFRLMTNQLAFITDTENQFVIDSWHNPYINETVEVFHGHNGPQDIEFDIEHLDLAVKSEGDSQVKASLDIPWDINQHFARAETNVRSHRKNALDSARWRREYTGEYLDATEWSEWMVPRQSLESVGPTLPCHASVQRFGNWYPWMLMERRPGGLYSRTVGGRLESLAEAPNFFVEAAERRYPTYLSAPKKWTGKFVDGMSVFMKERSPVPHGGNP